MINAKANVKRENIIRNKELDVDLWIIGISTALVFSLFVIIQNYMNQFIKDENINVIIRTIVIALFQYGIAGFGISIVMIYRRESFKYHGLVRTRLIQTIFFSGLCFIPYVLYLIISNQFNGYKPLSVMMTSEVLENGFPENIIGLLIIVVAWGFYEGFTYVVISNKINERYPTNLKLLNWGAVICTIMCVLIHGIIGVTSNEIIELICVIIIIYGMLIVQDITKNSWGVIAVFVLLWNAF